MGVNGCGWYIFYYDEKHISTGYSWPGACLVLPSFGDLSSFILLTKVCHQRVQREYRERLQQQVHDELDRLWLDLCSEQRKQPLPSSSHQRYRNGIGGHRRKCSFYNDVSSLFPIRTLHSCQRGEGERRSNKCSLLPTDNLPGDTERGRRLVSQLLGQEYGLLDIIRRSSYSCPDKHLQTIRTNQSLKLKVLLWGQQKLILEQNHPELYLQHHWSNLPMDDRQPRTHQYHSHLGLQRVHRCL